jgi:hypothetical protein
MTYKQLLNLLQSQSSTDGCTIQNITSLQSCTPNFEHPLNLNDIKKEHICEHG